MGSVTDRMRIAVLFAAPVLLLAGLYAWGMTLPLPELGRGYVVRVALPQGGERIGLPPVRGPQDPALPLVVIDPGHGGPDPGAIAGPYFESTLVLGLARALEAQLLRGGGIRVAMTRDRDRFVALGERVEIARALGADLFLSIHADSAGERQEVAGASIYVLSDEASSEAAARYAARENRADLLNGIPVSEAPDEVSAILVELAQRRTSASSARFAELILREGQGVLRFHPQPLRAAGLAVLRAPDVPGVLFEAGFVTNPDEARRLASPRLRADFARVMDRAIRIQLARDGAAGAGPAR